MLYHPIFAQGLHQELKYLFFLLSIWTEELISTPKFITLLPKVPLRRKKRSFPINSNAIFKIFVLTYISIFSYFNCTKYTVFYSNVCIIVKSWVINVVYVDYFSTIKCGFILFLRTSIKFYIHSFASIF